MAPGGGAGRGPRRRPRRPGGPGAPGLPALRRPLLPGGAAAAAADVGRPAPGPRRPAAPRGPRPGLPAPGWPHPRPRGPRPVAEPVALRQQLPRQPDGLRRSPRRLGGRHLLQQLAGEHHRPRGHVLHSGQQDGEARPDLHRGGDGPPGAAPHHGQSLHLEEQGRADDGQQGRQGGHPGEADHEGSAYKCTRRIQIESRGVV